MYQTFESRRLGRLPEHSFKSVCAWKYFEMYVNIYSPLTSCGSCLKLHLFGWTSCDTDAYSMRKVIFSIHICFKILAFLMHPHLQYYFHNSNSLLFLFCNSHSSPTAWRTVCLPSKPSFPFSFFSPSRCIAIQHLLCGTVKFKVFNSWHK